jgi:hypothetical protein
MRMMHWRFYPRSELNDKDNSIYQISGITGFFCERWCKEWSIMLSPEPIALAAAQSSWAQAWGLHQAVFPRLRDLRTALEEAHLAHPCPLVLPADGPVQLIPKHGAYRARHRGLLFIVIPLQTEKGGLVVRCLSSAPAAPLPRKAVQTLEEASEIIAAYTSYLACV